MRFAMQNQLNRRKCFHIGNTAYRDNPGSFRGFSQAVLDLRAAVHYAAQYELPITLFGHSMGGYAVCAVLNFADVTVDKVSIYGQQALLRKTNIRYLLFDQGIHSTHMGIVKGDSKEMLNKDLLKALT